MRVTCSSEAGNDERSRMLRVTRPQQITDAFDNAAVGIHLIGPDGVIMYANRCELGMMGYSWSEYVGHHISEYHVSAEKIESILARLAAGEVLTSCEAQLRCNDGSIRDVLISSNVLWEKGCFVHTRCFTTDVTERKQSERELREAHEQQKLLVGEMSHRVKNTLSTVQAIASQTLRSAQAEERAAFVARLHALAAAHDLLTNGRWDRARISDVVARALAPFEEAHSQRLVKAGPEAYIDAQQSMQLTMVFHELATNAVKYGALSNGTGKVHVRWERAEDDARAVKMHWEETGGPRVKPPEHSGFGSLLIKQVIGRDTEGAGLDYAEAGFRCTFQVRLSDSQ